jgi:site-specific DNA recombinase
MTTKTTAIYARYSSDQQKETSIDDQIRRCRELAVQHGLVVDEDLVFSDSAISGSAKQQSKREGYKSLIEAWEAGQFSVLVVDEFSRLTRDGVEQAMLIQRLEKNQRVRLITANGIDTAISNWQLNVGLIGMVGQQSTRDTRHRVVRGMLGQLERGYMVAPPALGYSLNRLLDGSGKLVGSHWKIEESSAVVVREIFERRAVGQSMHQIARWLNDSGVPLRRKPRVTSGGYWRAARVKNILENAIYRGQFVWNGSTTAHAAAKKEGRLITEVVFERPELLLVSDELWHQCNGEKLSKTGYGGGKHPLAGLVQCGYCGTVLSVTSLQRCRSVYCASCSAAKAMAGHQNRHPQSVAVVGVQTMLSDVLRHFLSPVFVEAFRERLRRKLTGDKSEEIDRCSDEIQKLQRAQERLSHILSTCEGEDLILLARYEETRVKVADAQVKLVALVQSSKPIDEEAVNAQMKVDPLMLLPDLFSEGTPPERLRSVLARLFPEIVLEGKSSKYTSIFRIGFAPGAAVALASQSPALDDTTLVRRYALRYSPIRKVKNVLERWSVVELPATDEVIFEGGNEIAAFSKGAMPDRSVSTTAAMSSPA